MAAFRPHYPLSSCFVGFAELPPAPRRHEILHARVAGMPSLNDLVDTFRPERPGLPATRREYRRVEGLAATLAPMAAVHPTFRGGGDATDKVDLPLTEHWLEAIRASCDAFADVDDLVACAKSAVAAAAAPRDAVLPSDLHTFWHVMITYPSSAEQLWHADLAESEVPYATLVVDLTPADGERGTTRFATTRTSVDDGPRTQHRFLTEDEFLALLTPDEADIGEERFVGKAALFDHTAVHGGDANRSDQARVSLFVTLTTATRDANDVAR